MAQVPKKQSLYDRGGGTIQTEYGEFEVDAYGQLTPEASKAMKAAKNAAIEERSPGLLGASQKSYDNKMAEQKRQSDMMQMDALFGGTGFNTNTPDSVRTRIDPGTGVLGQYYPNLPGKPTTVDDEGVSSYPGYKAPDEGAHQNALNVLRNRGQLPQRGGSSGRNAAPPRPPVSQKGGNTMADSIGSKAAPPKPPGLLSNSDVEKMNRANRKSRANPFPVGSQNWRKMEDQIKKDAPLTRAARLSPEVQKYEIERLKEFANKYGEDAVTSEMLRRAGVGAGTTGDAKPYPGVVHQALGTIELDTPGKKADFLDKFGGPDNPDMEMMFGGGPGGDAKAPDRFTMGPNGLRPAWGPLNKPAPPMSMITDADGTVLERNGLKTDAHYDKYKGQAFDAGSSAASSAGMNAYRASRDDFEPAGSLKSAPPPSPPQGARTPGDSNAARRAASQASYPQRRLETVQNLLQDAITQRSAGLGDNSVTSRNNRAQRLAENDVVAAGGQVDNPFFINPGRPGERLGGNMPDFNIPGRGNNVVGDTQNRFNALGGGIAMPGGGGGMTMANQLGGTRTLPGGMAGGSGFMGGLEQSMGGGSLPPGFELGQNGTPVYGGGGGQPPGGGGFLNQDIFNQDSDLYRPDLPQPGGGGMQGWGIPGQIEPNSGGVITPGGPKQVPPPPPQQSGGQQGWGINEGYGTGASLPVKQAPPPPPQQQPQGEMGPVRQAPLPQPQQQPQGGGGADWYNQQAGNSGLSNRQFGAQQAGAGGLPDINGQLVGSFNQPGGGGNRTLPPPPPPQRQQQPLGQQQLQQPQQQGPLSRPKAQGGGITANGIRNWQIGGRNQGLPPMRCWVAREVFGNTNPKWRQFRDWLDTKSPKWFRGLYIKYGERFANWIKDKPRLKNLIRRWMENKIELTGAN